MSEGGKKYDSNKSRVDLIPSEVLLSIGDIFAYGAKKYDEHNWSKGIKYSRLTAAAMRHLFAFKSGINDDEESKLNHLDHTITNLIMLKYMYNNRKDLDDRWEHHGTTKREIGTGVSPVGEQEAKLPGKESKETTTTIGQANQVVGFDSIVRYVHNGEQQTATGQHSGSWK